MTCLLLFRVEMCIRDRFEGTEATNEIIAQASIHDMAAMCRQVWEWYVEELSAKNE